MNQLSKTAGLRPNPMTDPFAASPFDTQYFRDCNALELNYDGPIPREERDAALARAYERLRVRRVQFLEEKIAGACARYDAIVLAMRATNMVGEIRRLNENADLVLSEIAEIRERLETLRPQQTVDFKRAAE